MMRSRSDSTDGQTLVEFAFILPIFILMLMGVLDLGRAVYASHTLNNAAREAARQAIVDQYADHIEARAIKHATGLGLAADDVAIDFRAADQPNTPSSCNGNLGKDAIVGCIAVVRVTDDFVAATPVIGNIVGVISMAGESRFPVGYNCATSTCPLGD